MNHLQEHFSQEEFAKMVATELDDYYAALGTRFERRFYFPGQNPFDLGSPADAISLFYWGLPRKAQLLMKKGLIDVLASRMELACPQALCQVVMAIGLIHDSELLQPLVRVVGQRSDNIESRRDIYAITVAVIIGFGPIHAALIAARELSNFKSFPDHLAYDVLEFLVKDPATLWSQSVTQLLPRMDADYKPTDYKRIKQRLTFVAQEIGARVGLNDLAKGLLYLIGEDVHDLSRHRFVSRKDPLGILLTQLFIEPGAPFSLIKKPLGELMLESQDGLQNLIVNDVQVFMELEESATPRLVNIAWARNIDEMEEEALT